MSKKVKYCHLGRPVLSPATAQVIGNEDLVLEILLRLPAKSLIQSKLVSKQWLSLISNPDFIQTHILQSPSCRAGLVCYNKRNQSLESSYLPLEGPQYNAGETVPSLAFLDDVLFDRSTRTKNLQSCNGLLLCMFRPDNLRMYETYVVCNQTTKKYKQIPLQIDIESLLDSVCTLAYDPSISSHYKVISLRVCLHEELCEVEIYSSENNSWRLSGSRVPHSMNGVFMNGVVYWDEYCINVYTEEVMRISDRDLIYRRIRPFEEYCKNWNALKKNIEEEDDRRILISEMSKESEKWVVKNRVSVGSFSLILNIPGAEKGFIPLCIVKGVHKGDLGLVLEIPGKLVYYNLMDDTVRTLCHVPEAMTLGIAGVYLFVESLASV